MSYMLPGKLGELALGQVENWADEMEMMEAEEEAEVAVPLVFEHISVGNRKNFYTATYFQINLPNIVDFHNGVASISPICDKMVQWDIFVSRVRPVNNMFPKLSNRFLLVTPGMLLANDKIDPSEAKKLVNIAMAMYANPEVMIASNLGGNNMEVELPENCYMTVLEDEVHWTSWFAWEMLPKKPKMDRWILDIDNSGKNPNFCRALCPPTPDEIWMAKYMNIVLMWNGFMLVSNPYKRKELMETSNMMMVREGLQNLTMKAPSTTFVKASMKNDGVVMVEDYYHEREAFVQGYRERRVVAQEITISDISTVKTWINMNEPPLKFSVKDVNVYFRVRHDMVHEAVMLCMNKPFEKERSLFSIFGAAVPEGKYNLTPDIIIPISELEDFVWAEIRKNLLASHLVTEDQVRSITHICLEVGVAGNTHLYENTKMAKYGSTFDEINATGLFNVLFLPAIFSPYELESKIMSIFDGLATDHLTDLILRLNTVHTKLMLNANFVEMLEVYFKGFEDTISWDDVGCLLKRDVVRNIFGGWDKLSENTKLSDFEDMMGFSMEEESQESYLTEVVNTIASLFEEEAVQIKEDKDNDKMFHGTCHASLGTVKAHAVVEVAENRVAHLQKVGEVYKEKIGKIPSIMKHPMMLPAESVKEVLSNPLRTISIMNELYGSNLLDMDDMLLDGTFRFNPRGMSDFTVKEFDANSRAGMGIQEDCLTKVEEFLEFLKISDYQHSEIYENHVNEVFKGLEFRDEDFKEKLKSMCNFNVMKVAYMMQLLTREVMYLAGRRSFSKTQKPRNVLKATDFGYLEINRGPTWTREHQLRYRLHSFSDHLVQNPSWGKCAVSQTMIQDPLDGVQRAYYSTKWISFAYTDAESFARLWDRMMLVCTHLLSTQADGMRTSLKVLDMSDNLFMIPLMFCLEHKRGTSTALQLNRYISHSMNCFIADWTGLVSKIGDEPIRSCVQMFVVQNQLNYMMANIESRMSRIVTDLIRASKVAEESDYDRYFMASFYGRKYKHIEYSMVMNERYYCNLFNKDGGFKGHRVKAIFAKMWTDEQIWRAGMEKRERKGMIATLSKFMREKQEYFNFDRRAVYIGMKLLEKEQLIKLRPQHLLSAILETLDDFLSLKSSVNTVPSETETLTASGSQEVRKTILENLNNLHETSGMLSLADYANAYGSMAAYFGTFPKPQIGGPREICIMDVDTRVKVRLSENISRKMCTSVTWEQLTKGTSKHLEQAQMKARMKTKYQRFSLGYGLFASYNVDHSHWSPSTNLLSFAYMFLASSLPESIKTYQMNICSYFTQKQILVSPALKEKWTKRSDEEKDPIMEDLRQYSIKNDFKLDLMSGFCQGILHHMSSLYHSVKMAFWQEINRRMFQSRQFRSFEEYQLSSDDITEYMYVTFTDVRLMEKALLMSMFARTCVTKLFNLSVNYKKTGLSFMESEFNSLFMIGKRVLPAAIKDVWTCCDIPDMTVPEDAVRMLVSYESRLMDAAVKLTVNIMARRLNRLFLIYAYRIDGDTKLETMAKLELTLEDDLPFHLGYLPELAIYESLVLGPDLYMFKPNMNAITNKFYNGIYHGIEHVTDYSGRIKAGIGAAHIGKRYMKLPVRNSRMFDEMMMMWSVDLECLKETEESLFWTRYTNQKTRGNFISKRNGYLGSSGCSYEFQDTIRMHSMIRALAMTSQNIRFMGISEKELDEGMFECSDTQEYAGSLMMDCKGVNRALSGSFSDFVDTIIGISMEQVTTTLPISDISMEAWASHEKMRTVINTARLDRTLFAHSKVRKMDYKPALHHVVSSVWKVINCMQGNQSYNTAMTRYTIAKIREFTKLSMRGSFIQNAVEAFPKSKTPKKDFYDLISKYTKILGGTVRVMVSEFPNKITLHANLENFYKYRSSCLGVLKERGEAIIHADEKSVLIGACMSASTNADEFYECIKWTDVFEDPAKEINYDEFKIGMKTPDHEAMVRITELMYRTRGKDVWKEVTLNTVMDKAYYKMIRTKNSPYAMHMSMCRTSLMIITAKTNGQEKRSMEFLCEDFEEETFKVCYRQLIQEIRDKQFEADGTNRSYESIPFKLTTVKNVVINRPSINVKKNCYTITTDVVFGKRKIFGFKLARTFMDMKKKLDLKVTKPTMTECLKKLKMLITKDLGTDDEKVMLLDSSDEITSWKFVNEALKNNLSVKQVRENFASTITGTQNKDMFTELSTITACDMIKEQSIDVVVDLKFGADFDKLLLGSLSSAGQVISDEMTAESCREYMALDRPDQTAEELLAQFDAAVMRQDPKLDLEIVEQLDMNRTDAMAYLSSCGYTEAMAEKVLNNKDKIMSGELVIDPADDVEKVTEEDLIKVALTPWGELLLKFGQIKTSDRLLRSGEFLNENEKSLDVLSAIKLSLNKVVNDYTVGGLALSNLRNLINRSINTSGLRFAYLMTEVFSSCVSAVLNKYSIENDFRRNINVLESKHKLEIYAIWTTAYNVMATMFPKELKDMKKGNFPVLKAFSLEMRSGVIVSLVSAEVTQFEF